VKYFIGFIGPDCSAKGNSLVKSNVVHSIVTGIHEKEVAPIQIFLSPNPVTNFVTVKTNESIQNIALIDVVGRIVLTTDQKTISCSNLPSGVYFIKVMTSKGIGLQKFVKE
jgi:hypothetical protein